MKKTILLFLLMTSTILFAQETKPETSTIKKKYPEYVFIDDIKRTDDGKFSMGKEIILKNGKKEDIKIPLKADFGKNEPSSRDLGKININLDQTIWLAKFKLKNPVTYVPTSVNITKLEASWKIVLWYYAKNNLGIEKEGMEVYKYDLTGKAIK
jgi:hypothetical protein